MCFFKCLLFWQKVNYVVYFVVLGYDITTKQEHESVQEVDLLSLHLRMHVGREERATDSLLAECRSQDDDLTTSCLRPAVTQQPPNATRTGEAREEALGTRRPLSLCRGGGVVRVERQARAQI